MAKNIMTYGLHMGDVFTSNGVCLKTIRQVKGGVECKTESGQLVIIDNKHKVLLLGSIFTSRNEWILS